MNTDHIIQLEADYVLQTYKRPPIVFERGEGMTLTDAEGRTYLDFTSGIAVTALGHSDPELVAAVQEQVACLSHVSNLYHTAPHAELAALLCENSFADKVYYCNSGAEANEAAIKFARRYGQGRTQVVAFSGAFHGRTYGALAITPREKYQKPFEPLMPDVAFAPFNDLNAAKALIGPETCAVFVEPLQGEGGIHLAEPAFLEGLRALCDEHDALLVFDEVQCGVGRTGKLWGYEHYGVTPDIMTLAKALGGGQPIGATLVTQAVAGAVHVGDHASTFAAGPVATRAAQVVVRRAMDMLAHIDAMGVLIRERITALGSPHVKAVRGLGLMIGVELDQPAAPIMQAGYEHGLLLLTAGPNVLRLLPPYIVTEAEVEPLMAFLEAQLC